MVIENLRSDLERLLGSWTPECILELGARDCAETIALSHCWPESKVFAFECNPATLPACRDRVSGHPRIDLIEMAVADESGPLPFFQIDQERTETTWADGNPGASSLYRATGRYPRERYVQRAISVVAIRLDEFLAERGIRHIGLLWMDIQGAELQALRSLGARIANVDVIFTEVSFFPIYEGTPRFRAIHRHLKQSGFKLVKVADADRYQGNVIYIRTDLIPEQRKRVATWSNVRSRLSLLAPSRLFAAVRRHSIR